ncbi:MAG: Uma2 family endonuclease [Roseofilum sp. SBFL]|uniref:Uma2 family endonuclease n=1 Tax=unclassified Roseofilum TaxID=2620099 RepID=UPI001AFDDFEA|nr:MULTISPECIES: Uma2 family endonuclease [unclassified Roseofilum]MBP0015453.1 Uma2 family endonuclease [Roseofilum sp. SID3]MBP0023229.1 Uma2 family endonuclease [Roseofilum sp. SID2]MBP0039879.1 Uma2 family endonuclease [Roseofilum sp. SID1]MBP0041490.1 Uma2 family endonuclease [Roseofilum sp. SBFL]
MLATSSAYKITWEKLPDDFQLPDDPVDNIYQPALAAALTESLNQAGKLSENSLTPTNYGICATVNGKMVVKAPDWAYIPQIRVDRQEVSRSYTPNLQGDPPVIVLEFLSETEGGEYSTKSTYPPGKYFYYEQILCVPNYGIFDPKTGELELRRLGNQQRYALASPNSEGRFWIPEMDLYLGVWQGCRETLETYWLRWWDDQGNLIPWSTEKTEQAEQRAEAERQRADAGEQRAEAERQRADAGEQRAEAERQRADRLAAQLRAAGIEIKE